MSDTVSKEHLKRYFSLTTQALALAKKAPVHDKKAYDEIISMVECYVSDAHHFSEKGDIVLAFAALNYAHGWLDCGASLGIFFVDNNRLFTVDGKK